MRAAYRVRLAANALSRTGPLGLAGSDAERLAAYRELLLDPDVEAILLARGGYGITRILGDLDPEEVRGAAKLHCGFSDATALSAFLLRTAAILLLAAAFAQQTPPAGGLVESGKYRLHKFGQAIGEETYEIRCDGGALTLTDKFLFTDRGSPVPLATTFRAAPDWSF